MKKHFLLGYVENDQAKKALNLFEEMLLNGEDATYTNIFSACAQLADHQAKIIVYKLFNQISTNIKNNVILLNSAIHTLMKFHDVKYAENLFQMAENKDIITYAVMMKGYFAQWKFFQTTHLLF